ncbi:MAG: RNA polymerase sigma factor [Cyclobacteriaceae bacterium]
MKIDNQDRIAAYIRGCRKQDRDSQRSLYQEFYGYGMSICIRYVKNRDEAVEILNDGFLKVFNNLKGFDLTKSFKPWFSRIMVNTAINHYRKNLKFSKNENLEMAENKANQNEEILSGISYQEIIGMVHRLSPKYRLVFNLYVIEGYTHEEIAEMLEISVGTSKSNLFKAKKNLREILDKFFKTQDAG